MRLRIRESKTPQNRRTTFYAKRKIAIIFSACALWSAAYLFYRIARRDGGYSEWSNFSSCSASCGRGTRTKTRTCTQPEPNFFGRPCVGAKSETITCLVRECPVNGGFTDWSEFGSCSVSCGVGVRRRTRLCEKPKPRHGGLDCKGDTVETAACKFSVDCPVDGGFTEWSKFTTCSVTCGIGFQWRSRNCTNPAPKHGGKMCKGAIKEKHHCQIDCVFNGAKTTSANKKVSTSAAATEPPKEWITQF